MSSNGSQYRNIILISQISICVMVPMFLCLALGLWLDNKFGTWFTVPLLLLGSAAGARNAYVLAINTVKQEERRRQKKQEEHIQELIARKKAEEDRKNSGL